MSAACPAVSVYGDMKENGIALGWRPGYSSVRSSLIFWPGVLDHVGTEKTFFTWTLVDGGPDRCGGPDHGIYHNRLPDFAPEQ